MAKEPRYKFEAELVCCWSDRTWTTEPVSFEMDYPDPMDDVVLGYAIEALKIKDEAGNPPEFFALSGHWLNEDEDEEEDSDE